MPDKHMADAIQALMAGAGGIIAALLRKETHSWSDTLIAGAGAVFLGFIVAKICRVSGCNEDVSIIITSLSGWLGAERTSHYLEKFVARKLGLSKEAEKDEEEK